MHFVSSTRQAPASPKRRNRGGAEIRLTLELKMIADVGLNWVAPNGGKSALLARLVMPVPKVADYPFDAPAQHRCSGYWRQQFAVIADIPGKLIEETSPGRKLGDIFFCAMSERVLPCWCI